MKRLRIASSVGWLAEFPLELWEPIVRFALGRNVDAMDVAMALRLASVSRGLCALVMPHCLTLLRTVVARDQPQRWAGSSHRLSEQIQRFMWEVEGGDDYYIRYRRATPKHTHLRRYLTQCATQLSCQSAEHLINALSLVHFVQQERRVKLNNFVTRSLPRAGDAVYLSQVVHFDGKRARLLSRMLSLCVCWEHADELVQRARSLCHDHNEPRDHSAMSVETDPARRLSLATRVLQRHDALSVEKVDGDAMLCEVVLKRGARYDHIMSVEGADFRRACYASCGLPVAQATLACRLTAHHERNWHWLLESDRFKVGEQ